MSPARKRANEKYKKAHVEQQRVYIARSTAKRFIKEYATTKDIKTLRELLDQREKELNS